MLVYYLSSSSNLRDELMISDFFYNQFTLLAQPSLPTLSANYWRASVRDFSFLTPFPTAFRPNRPALRSIAGPQPCEG
jgi:hypothetical protein